MPTISTTDREMLAFLTEALFQKKTPHAEAFSEDVLTALRKQCVASLCSDLFEKYPAKTPAADRLILSTFKETQVFQTISAGTRELMATLAADNIRAVTIKGLAAAKYYPHPEYRTFGDIDFFAIDESGALCDSRARELLSQRGYIFLSEPTERHDAFKKDGVSFEMHHYFAPTDTKETDRVLNRIIADALPQTKKQDLGTPLLTLPAMENGLVILCHLSEHLYFGFGLRQVIDFLLFAYTELDDEAWNARFLPLTQKTKTTRLVKALLRLGKKYLGLPAETKDKKPLTWDTDVCPLTGAVDTAANATNARPLTGAEDAYAGTARPDHPAGTKKTYDLDAMADDLLLYVLQNGNFKYNLSAGEGASQSLSSKIRANGLWKTAYENGLTNWPEARKSPFLRVLAPFYQMGRWVKNAFSKKYGAGEVVKGLKGTGDWTRLFQSLQEKEQ